MKKPKSKEKQMSAVKRGLKRSNRLKSTRIKVAKKRAADFAAKKEARRKYQEFMTQLLASRLNK